MLDSFFLYTKFIATLIGGFLLLVGSSIEPSVGVWVISLGGSLLSIALGPDKKFLEVFFYLVFGLFWGIFGSQVIHSLSPVPQVAAAFFSSLFGSEATWYFMRTFRNGDAGGFLLAIIDKINPYSALKEKGKKE